MVSNITICPQYSPQSEQYITDRLSYCRHVLRQGIKTIIFTDESTIVLDISKKGICKKRSFHPPFSYFPKYHHPIQVIVVCGAIGPNGFRTNLIRCFDSLTDYRYCKLLGDNHVFFSVHKLAISFGGKMRLHLAGVQLIL